MPSPQAPIHSGYDSASTAAQVIEGVSLAGKTAIVTGGYSGLGLETVRVLAGAGAASSSGVAAVIGLRSRTCANIPLTASSA